MSPRAIVLGKLSAALVSGGGAWLWPGITWFCLGGGLAAFALWDWLAAPGESAPGAN